MFLQIKTADTLLGAEFFQINLRRGPFRGIKAENESTAARLANEASNPLRTLTETLFFHLRAARKAGRWTMFLKVFD